MNKEKNKNNISKIIFIIFLIFILIYIITILYKYKVFKELDSNYEKYSSSKNIKYFVDNKDSKNIGFIKKDGIVKSSIFNEKNKFSVIYWYDYNNNDYYTIFETKKEYNYSKEKKSIMLDTPLRSIGYLSMNMICNPLISVIPVKYDDRDCYMINNIFEKDIVDKETGFSLKYKGHGRERIVKFELNTVTDELINIIDLSEYKKVDYK